MSKAPIDPLRAHLTELLEAIDDRLANLRDYAHVPGNAWLAKSELGQISQLASDVDALLDEIKSADVENGY
jgi:hypothetical protein